MAALLTNATNTTPGDAVSFTAPTTLFPEGVFAGAIAIVEARVPTKEWVEVHKFFDTKPRNIQIEKAYELRATLFGVAPGTSISINATE